MASVAIRDVRKAFGATAVIHGVDISIRDGEFVVLVGPSGCGKSTLLRMIAGLENITGGEIRIGDRVVNRLPPKQRDGAMVFQNYAREPPITGHSLCDCAARRKARSMSASIAQQRSSACPNCLSVIRDNCQAASASASPWVAP